MTGAKAKRVLLPVPAIAYRTTGFVAAAQRLGLDAVIGSDGALTGAAGVLMLPVERAGVLQRIDDQADVVEPMAARRYRCSTMCLFRSATFVARSLPMSGLWLRSGSPISSITTARTDLQAIPT